MTHFSKLAAASMSLLAAACLCGKDVDWPAYGGDKAGTRYSQLEQINTNNVGGGYATVRVIAGSTAIETIVDFFNRSNPGVVKVCKISIQINVAA